MKNCFDHSLTSSRTCKSQPDVIDGFGALVGESQRVRIPLEFQSLHLEAVLGEKLDQLVDDDAGRQLAEPSVGSTDH